MTAFLKSEARRRGAAGADAAALRRGEGGGGDGGVETRDDGVRRLLDELHAMQVGRKGERGWGAPVTSSGSKRRA